MSIIVAGIDPSLRGTAVCVKKGEEFHFLKCGYPLNAKASHAEKLIRIHKITKDVLSFLREQGAQRVSLEDYTFNSKQGAQAAFQAELSGVLKVRAFEVLGKCPLVINAHQCRKLIFGKDVKEKKEVSVWLKANGYQGFSNHDEADAMVLSLVADKYFNQRSSFLSMYEMELMSKLDASLSLVVSTKP